MGEDKRRAEASFEGVRVAKGGRRSTEDVPGPDRRAGGSSPGKADGASPARTGDDTRRRGWFWHWNTIITQFAPLIGLKGVGLLNSYTVWTDRREDSPYQGYAFPSQQAEAAFYGEERAELITINKILVALDLIEIRKEMVTRTDEAGRRWKVPHNFYRVKDRPDGFALTPEAVLRVAELAARDHAVYRYVRHVFSARFAPIDRDNVWHQILPLVRQHPTWQQLAERAAQEEARASARTRAGHARRRQARTPATVPEGHTSTEAEESAPTVVAPTNNGSATDVARGNNGSRLVVAPANSGSATPETSSVADGNEGRESSVAQSNTTYDQAESTTTTTTSEELSAGTHGDGATLADSPALDPHPPAGLASGPLPEPSSHVVACYEAANGRSATPLERLLLGELELEFAGAARQRDIDPGDWVVAAIREAVSSGSTFVAPKRIREILSRWSAPATGSGTGSSAGVPTADPLRPRAVSAPGPVGDRPAARSHRRRDTVWAEDTDSGLLPGRSSREERYGRDAASSAPGTPLQPAGWIQPGRPPLALATGAETVQPDVVHQLVALLTEALGIPRRVSPAGAPALESGAQRETSSAAATVSPAEELAVPRVRLPGGLTNSQLWAMAQELMQGRLPPASFENWIRPAVLLAFTERGEIVLGAPSRAACQRLEGRLRPVIEDVLSELLGRPVAIHAVVMQEWLRRWETHETTEAESAADRLSPDPPAPARGEGRTA